MNVVRVSKTVIIALVLMTVFTVVRAGAATAEERMAAIKAERNDAIFKVQHIVNQPVTHLKRTPDMHVSVYSPGWFHPGAFEPGYDHVDIRKTQELQYENQQYVTSDLNPGEVFLGAELEFNPMTKYFYTDRSVPKKRLTEDEMLQINALYRVIGHCDEQLDELQHPEPVYYKIHDLAMAHKPAVFGAAAVLLAGLIFIRKRRVKV